MSYYPTDVEAGNDVEMNLEAPERQCSRCRGLGTDRDGADCLYCDGWGSVISRY